VLLFALVIYMDDILLYQEQNAPHVILLRGTGIGRVLYEGAIKKIRIHVYVHYYKSKEIIVSK
jgi:hypothetical protein